MSTTDTVLYEVGRCRVRAIPKDDGGVEFRAEERYEVSGSTYWCLVEYPGAWRGYAEPGFLQRPIAKALDKAIRACDKQYRNHLNADFGVSLAQQSIEGLKERAEAMRLLDNELGAASEP